ncbi:hypothetical protein ABT337_27935 [Saccharopolyspora hirsuta]|uniref:hypothetical protein n=1 Tax=Saccharopolyspora hirsuta TaxID=1837 RepID=UPI003327C810
MSETAERCGRVDEGVAILAIDRFVLEHRLADGRTALERFVAQRKPPLSDTEREMLLGWLDVVESFFEVVRFDGDAVLLHDLVGDLVYRACSNIGREGLSSLREGAFLVGRIVPVHPATDAWMLSGYFTTLPASAGQAVAAAAAERITERPELLRRNPALVRKAREILAEHRADFIDQLGSDLVVLPPNEAQEALREHYRRQQQRAMATSGATKGERTRNAGPAPAVSLPADMLEADSVALIYDEVEGLGHYRDFGRLDELFADPGLARRDRTYLAQLRDYLNDDSISPMPIRRLVQRHPDGADRVFRALLRKPGFSWERDGEDLLRRRKKAHFEREPTPGITTVGERLAELLRTT